MNNPAWIVKDVQAKEDYTLLITFIDGEKRIYNAHSLLKKAIYAPLCNLAFFLGAKAECGTVIWNNDVDIAPEHLYECSNPVGDIANA